MSYLVSKFGYSEDKAKDAEYLMNNGFEILFGFGGEIDSIRDIDLDNIITPDNVWLYSKSIREKILNIIE